MSFQKILIFPPKNFTVPKIRMRRFFFFEQIKGKKTQVLWCLYLLTLIVLQSINKITKQYLLSVFASFIIFQQ